MAPQFRRRVAEKGRGSTPRCCDPGRQRIVASVVAGGGRVAAACHG